jgi:hypothetical protein
MKIETQKLLISAIVFLIIVNIYLLYLLLIKQQNNEADKEQTQTGYIVDGIETQVYTNLGLSQKFGYVVDLNDTLRVNQLLCVNYLHINDSVPSPQDFLYELDEGDSSFKLLSNKPYGSQTQFEFVQRNFKTKMLFIKTNFMSNKERGCYSSSIVFKSRDANGNVSSDMPQETMEYFFEKFLSQVAEKGQQIK